MLRLVEEKGPARDCRRDDSQAARRHGTAHVRGDRRPGPVSGDGELRCRHRRRHPRADDASRFDAAAVDDPLSYARHRRRRGHRDAASAHGGDAPRHRRIRACRHSRAPATDRTSSSRWRSTPLSRASSTIGYSRSTMRHCAGIDGLAFRCRCARLRRRRDARGAGVRLRRCATKGVRPDSRYSTFGTVSSTIAR